MSRVKGAEYLEMMSSISKCRSLFRQILICAVSLLLCAVSNAEPFVSIKVNEPVTIESLRQFILINNIRTLKDLLPHLPDSYLDNPAFAYESRSPQASLVNPLQPRVVLAGPNGKTTLAFTTNKDNQDSGQLEIGEFDNTRRKLVMKQITFPNPNDKVSPPIFEGTAATPKPTTCLKCHGDDSHHIWDIYPFWPGFYFGVKNHFADSAAERANFRKLIETAPNNPLLTPLLKAMEKIEKRNKFGAEANDEETLSLMTENYTQLNAKRLARIISQTSDFARFKYATMAVLFRCENPESYLPPGFFGDDKTPLETEYAKFHDYVIEHGESLVKRMGKVGPMDTVKFSQKQAFIMEVKAKNGTSELRDEMQLFDYTREDRTVPFILIFERRGIPTEGWGMTLNQKIFLESSPGKGIYGELIRELNKFVQIAPQDDPAIKGYYRGPEEICKNLKRKSLEALANYTIQKPVTANASPIKERRDCDNLKSLNVIPQTCIKCHVNPDKGTPAIPFNEVIALKTYISQNAGALAKIENLTLANAPEKIRMPKLGKPLPDEDRLALLRYLEEVKYCAEASPNITLPVHSDPKSH